MIFITTCYNHLLSKQALFSDYSIIIMIKLHNYLDNELISPKEN